MTARLMYLVAPSELAAYLLHLVAPSELAAHLLRSLTLLGLVALLDGVIGGAHLWLC